MTRTHMPVITKHFRQLLGRTAKLAGQQTLATKLWSAARGCVLVPLARRIFPGLARLYRSQLTRVVFIGVTGSCGKTTTKELIDAVLGTQFRGRKNPGNMNQPFDLVKTVLQVRPSDNYCVLEIAAAIRDKRIPFEVPLGLVRPQIGVVTNIGTDHLSAFHTVDAIAAEKGKLVAALPPSGTAVLNADDPRVRAMHSRCAGRVITYGFAQDAMVRAEDICSRWPERLSLTVLYRGQSQRVYTQLCGAHWVPCVLAAVAVGIATDVPLATIAKAIRGVPPFAQRMSPQSQSGVTFIRDDAKAPLWSIPATIQFMQEAQAARKVIVFGNISDYPGNSERVYISVARQALSAADHVVFVGTRASKCLKAKRHAQDETLKAFFSREAASEYFREWLRPGDLVLLKGSERDGMGKIIRDLQRQPNTDATRSMPSCSTRSERTARAVVGLANPGEKYHNTPHNIGARVLDLLAGSLEGKWAQDDQAMVSRVQVRGQNVYLIKPLTAMNAAGPALAQLLQTLRIAPSDSVLVQDDLDMPLGAVRVRMQGSDGGHRGVRSVLEALRTDALPRVKVGVGQPGQKEEFAKYVLTAFSSADLPVVEAACGKAMDRVLDLISGMAGSRVEDDLSRGHQIRPTSDTTA